MAAATAVVSLPVASASSATGRSRSHARPSSWCDASPSGACTAKLLVWEPALTGDLRAVGQVVQIMAARSRLLGLMPLGKKSRVKCRQPQTVVLMKDDCRERGCPDHT